jgi:hypothetical protein
MSHSYNQKRKLIRRFKREFGDPFHPGNWYSKYRECVDQTIKEKEGTPIMLEQLMNTEGSLFKPNR